MRAEREQRARGGEERPRGAGCLGIKRGTWTLWLVTRAVSSRRGNCVLKNQAHDSQHYHDCFFFFVVVVVFLPRVHWAESG